MRVREMIVQGELAPGSLLTEREMAARLEIGRTPVREALQRLVREHFLSVVANGGYLVTTVGPMEIRYVYELRRPIEAMSARLAATRASERDVASLRALLTEMESAADIADGAWHLSLDGRFHDLIAASTGNPYLRETINQLIQLTARILVATRGVVMPAQEEMPFYVALVDAIAAHDGDEAEKLMRAHLPDDPVTDGLSLG